MLSQLQVALSNYTLAVFVVASCTTAKAAIVLQTETFGGHTYHLIGGDATGAGINWTDSEAFAQTLGGHLATVSSAEEDAFLYNTFGDAQIGTRHATAGLFIGLNDLATEGTFVWSNGDPVTYTNWDPFAPGNKSGLGDTVYIRGAATAASSFPSTWNDIQDIPFSPTTGWQIYAVAEISPVVPEPTALVVWSLLGTCGFFAWGRRRCRRGCPTVAVAKL